MAIMPKPELEQGNYLVYTDEPDTVYDNAGGGGGGGAAFDEYQIAVHLYCGDDSSFEDIEPFKDECILYNGEPLTGFTMNSDVGAFEKLLNVKALDVITGLSFGVPGLGEVALSEDNYDWCLAAVRPETGKPAVIFSTVDWVNPLTPDSDIPWVKFLVDKAVL